MKRFFCLLLTLCLLMPLVSSCGLLLSTAVKPFADEEVLEIIKELPDELHEELMDRFGSEEMLAVLSKQVADAAGIAVEDLLPMIPEFMEQIEGLSAEDLLGMLKEYLARESIEIDGFPIDPSENGTESLPTDDLTEECPEEESLPTGEDTF